MALQKITSCCDETTLLQLAGVCDCFAGFEIAGLTPATIYTVIVSTAKSRYYRGFTTDGAGLLLIDVTAFPERLFNQFAGAYTLEIEGVTFGVSEYTGFTFSISDCTDVGFFTIEQTPNE